MMVSQRINPKMSILLFVEFFLIKKNIFHHFLLDFIIKIAKVQFHDAIERESCMENYLEGYFEILMKWATSVLSLRHHNKNETSYLYNKTIIHTIERFPRADHFSFK